MNHEKLRHLRIHLIEQGEHQKHNSRSRWDEKWQGEFDVQNVSTSILPVYMIFMNFKTCRRIQCIQSITITIFISFILVDIFQQWKVLSCVQRRHIYVNFDNTLNLQHICRSCLLINASCCLCCLSSFMDHVSRQVNLQWAFLFDDITKTRW